MQPNHPGPPTIAEAPQPSEPIPRNLRQTRRYNDTLLVAGHGPAPARVMLLLTAPSDAEVSEEMKDGFNGIKLKDNPKYLKGPAGIMLRDILTRVGQDVRDMYVTSLIKWELPKGRRYSPKPTDVELARDCLERELEEVKPELVLCFGKAAFEFMTHLRLKYDSITGGHFWSEQFQCKVVPMDQLYTLEKYPEYIEKFRILLNSTFKLLGIHRDSMRHIPRDFRVIRDSQQLIWQVNQWRQENRKLFSVDCEWDGMHHVDGKLRSFQLCWESGVAAYIRFMDDQGQYVFDVSYKEAGRILGEYLNQPDVKYVGHHISADFPWMHYHLGLEYWDKCMMDTEFAMQTCDEHQELGLDWLAVKETPFGRYDIPLELCKKEIKLAKGEGYGRIPDDILIPYGCLDVATVYEAWPRVYQDLVAQQLDTYYFGLLNPFVTNVFTEFVINGLPMDLEKMDELRELVNQTKQFMERQLQSKMTVRAKHLLLQAFREIDPVQADLAEADLDHDFELRRLSPPEAADSGWPDLTAERIFDNVVPPDRREEYRPFLLLYQDAPNFNIRSGPQMANWLFNCERYTPVKSTANKDKGMPSMAWHRIMEFPPARQKEFKPAVDKQTLKILSDQHGDNELLRYLLRFNAIGNLAKAFLKEPEIDEETGEVSKENGLHFWVASDLHIHGQLSLTDTGRPRSWNPNTLNWPSSASAAIKQSILEYIEYLRDQQVLPDRYRKYLEKDKIPSIRSCVSARSLGQEYCMTESDFVTAEVRGLAFISGDENLIRLVTGVDHEFALTKDYKAVRIQFLGDSPVRPEYQRPEFLLSTWYGGKMLHQYCWTDLLFDDQGNMVHPKLDLHWSLVEMYRGLPREMLVKSDRDSGKIANFSTAYGATPNSLERKIEADTGVKPPEGAAQEILDTLERRQPVAFAFLRSMEEKQYDPGYYRAASGRIRHCNTHPEWSRMRRRDRDGYESGQGRQLRNFPMQESVGATAARACLGLLATQRKFQLVTRTRLCLYDSAGSIGPLRERFLTKRMHEWFMHENNSWQYHGRTLRYPIETDFNVGWSDRPSAEIQKLWDDPEFQHDQKWTDEMLERMEIPAKPLVSQ